MSNSNKGLHKFAMVIVFTLILSATSPVTMAKPADQFTAIWNAINNLQQQVNDLQNQINNIQLIPGPQGTPGISGYEIVSNVYIFPGQDQSNAGLHEEYIYCPSEKRVISGGFSAEPWSYFKIMANTPTPNGDGWRFFAFNENSIDRSVTLYAICANVQ